MNFLSTKSKSPPSRKRREKGGALSIRAGLIFLLLVLLACWTCAAQKVAITFDDLPLNGDLPPGVTSRAMEIKIPTLSQRTREGWGTLILSKTRNPLSPL